MSKQSGIGAAFWIDGYDISGDVASLSRFNSGRAVLPLTGIDKGAMERVHGLRDGGMEVASWFNDDAGGAHTVLKTMPTANRMATYAHRNALGASAVSCICKQIEFGGQRADDGALPLSTTVESTDYGMEWGVLLTAGKATLTAGNGTGVDFGTGSTAFGLQAFLHVFAFTGTSAAIKLQESSDNAGDAYADVTGGAFASVTTAPQAQRIETSRTLTVERYLRVVVAGTFSNLSAAVIVKRNAVSTVF